MYHLVNDAVLVLVHDAEGLLELLDGLLVELSRLRSGALLGGLLLGGLGLKHSFCFKSSINQETDTKRKTKKC